jgi:hypothetical protein
MRRLRILTFITGLALLVGDVLLVSFVHMSPLTIVGLLLAIAFLYQVLRALFGPIASNPPLRTGQILLALPVSIYSVSAFFAAWSVTSDYAPWVFALGVLLYFGVSRRYVRKLPHKLAREQTRRKDPGDSSGDVHD